MGTFLSCPIASRFIDTRDDALAYYVDRMVGDHAIDVKGVPLVVRFNVEEIHILTESTPCKRCPGCEVTERPGSRERRCFSRERARRMDDILTTLGRASAVLEARISGGRTVYGPVDRNAQRLAVVIAPGGGVWFVRTVWPTSAQSFRQACRSARPVPWPPK